MPSVRAHGDRNGAANAPANLTSDFNPDYARLWIVVHHVFVATVTVVMDYVYHKDDPQATERKREILNGYETLERSQVVSTIARRGAGAAEVDHEGLDAEE